MLTQDQLQRKLGNAFDPAQAALLAEVVTEAYAELVKTHDFNELKEIVRDLAQAQVRTEQRIDTLVTRIDELAQAQVRTEQQVDTLATRMDELAQAQVRTEESVRQLSEEMRDVKRQLGGLSTTVGLSFRRRSLSSPARLAASGSSTVGTGTTKAGICR